MSRVTTCLLLLLAAALGVAFPLPLAAQESGTAITEQLVEDWNQRLDLVEQRLNRVDTTAESASKLFDLTAKVHQQAELSVKQLQPRIEAVQRRLDAMGPAPAEGAAPATAEEAQRRSVLDGQLRGLNWQLTEARLTILRAEELDKRIGDLTQRKKFEALFHEYPPPWAPATWGRAVPEFLSIIEKIARSPVSWWRGLSAQQRQKVFSPRLAAELAFVLVLAWLVRRWVLSRYGRDPALSEPSYRARLLGAIAGVIAKGIIPAAVFGGLLYVAWPHRVAEESLFWTVVTALLAVLMFISLAWSLPYAVFAPRAPQWRLLPVSPENARRLSWRSALLAGIFAVATFLDQTQQQIGVSDSYLSVSTFILATLLAVPLIELTRQSYWKTEPSPESAEPLELDSEEEADIPGSSVWSLLRRLAAPVAFAGILAGLLGYVDLADFLIINLLLSALALVAVAILRGLARELTGAVMRSNAMISALGLRHAVRSRLKFWLRLLVDTILVIAAPLLIASIWISPFLEYWKEARSILSGVTVGGVTISFSDLLVAVLLFAAAMALTRLGQRFLTNKVLPQTGFDSGVQNSLSAGFGYVGILLASVLGISALGIDLSNIALIAGALSVGIGFGLQTIVSNFVAGIILLIERPVKVGDWVVVGGNEGFVKNITVRSTELQTFQRASVIIPNSEFISTSVTNWTHKDRYGRIELPVGVAYGSDVEKVRELLLDCANRHERVLTSPEPQVLFMNFGNSSLDFELRCFTNEVTYRLFIASDLRFAIDKAFRENGIEIPFPQHVIHFADQVQLPKSGDSEANAPA